MTQFLAVLNPDIPTDPILSVLDTIENGGGQVLSTWGNSVLIGDADPDVIDAVHNSDGVAFATSGAIPDFPLDLDDIGQDLSAAWMMGQSPFLQQLIDDFANAGIDPSQALPEGGCNPGSEDAGGIPGDLLNLPGFLDRPASFLAPARALANRRALVNTVGVSILQIDGPAGSSTAFTPTDLAIAMISLSRAFDLLQNLAPAKAHLVFTTDVRKAKISDPAFIPFPANPNKPTQAEYDTIEATWRDPALQALGMGSGRQGLRNLVNNSRFLFPIDWGFVFILTKYRAAFPGYAPGPVFARDVVISYSMEESAGFLPILPLIFAHEIGHTTGTADEYQPCSPFQKVGFSNFINANCAANPASVSCLMRDMSHNVCDATRSHFGWGDQNGDGIIDAFDPNFVLFP